MVRGVYKQRGFAVLREESEIASNSSLKGKGIFRKPWIQEGLYTESVPRVTNRECRVKVRVLRPLRSHYTQGLHLLK